MEEIFNVENYKRHLIDYYHYACDMDKQAERKAKIDEIKEEKFNRIIQNTQNFSLFLLEKMKKENHTYEDSIFTEVEISDYCEFIRTGCTGGYTPDHLFYPLNFNEDFCVSYYLLRQFFKNFSIDKDCDLIEYYNEEEDVETIVERPLLKISGPVENFNELCNNFLGKSKEIIDGKRKPIIPNNE